ncbi:MAG TPA: DUF1622 domain-containing protein [Rubricoccaceae bacterium]|jgi:uncharacterized membrane protein
MTSDRPTPETPRRGADWPEVVLALGLIAGLVVLLSVDIGTAPAAEGGRTPFEGPLRLVVNYLAVAAEIAAAVVIGWGVLHGAVAYAWRLVRQRAAHVDAAESIRLRLGRVLALGIEFTLASDILRTAVAPTRADILTLGAIVLLRTLLNLFLEREIRTGEARREDAAPAG